MEAALGIGRGRAKEGRVPRLFSYGTLQLPAVQRATFGRELEGVRDTLEGFRIEEIEIADPTVVALSGKTRHLVLRVTGLPDDSVEGVIFELSDAELAAADGYETDDYARIATRSRGGVETFAYVLAADVS